jgi:hypothetical protein
MRYMAGAIWFGKYIAGKVVKVLIMTFAYRSARYFLRFTPLNTVHAELELEESVSELMTSYEVHEGGDLDWEMKGRKLNFKLWMTFAYHYLFFGFTPLNTVHTKLELEESMSELMTSQEVHGGGDLVWKIEGKVVKVLILTFAYRSTCYLFYSFTQLNMVYSELELEESMTELMTSQEVHGGGDLVWKIHSRKSSKSFNYDICLSFHLLFILQFHSAKHGLRRA